MNELDNAQNPPPPPSALAGSNRGPWILAAVLVVIAAIAGWWYWRWQKAAPVAVVPQAAPAAPAQAKSDALPSIPANSDLVLLEWVQKIFATPDARWTEGGDLARRIAGLISTVSNGEDPRPFMRTFVPAQHFAVETHGGKSVISPKSEARFDSIADSIVSARPAVVADGYKAVHPLLGAAWKEIAPPNSDLDVALDKALANLLAVKVPEGGTEVVPKGAIWAYADASLEKLSPAQKALVRMGPKNAQRIQTQLRAIGQAIGLPSAR
jgi:hypothetical protein